MKRLLLAFGIMIALATGVFAEGGRTVFVDTQIVFNRTKLGQKYQSVIREYVESRKKVLDAEAAEIHKIQEDFDRRRSAGTLTEMTAKEGQEDLNRRLAEFHRKRNEFEAAIGKKSEEVSDEFGRKMSSALKSLSRKEKISLVLNKNMQKIQVASVLFADDDLDITEKLIAEMDRSEI